MKRKMRFAALLCAVCVAAALGGCVIGNGDDIVNQKVSVEGIKKISVRCGSSGSGGDITLGTGDQQAFIKMVNGFTLSDAGSPGKKGYQTGYCFDVEDEEGQAHSFHFFDQTMTVDLDQSYQISPADAQAVRDYWDAYGLADMLGDSQVPEEVLTCKAYLERTKPELKLDWSQYSVGEINEAGYRHGGFTGIEDPASADWSRYRLVSAGDALSGEYVYLILDIEEDKIVAEQWM